MFGKFAKTLFTPAAQLPVFLEHWIFNCRPKAEEIRSTVKRCCLRKVVVTRFFPRDVAEDHGTLEAGQLPRPGTDVVKSRQRTSGAESVNGQCRMRGALGQMAASTARILDFANSGNKNVTECYVHCSKDERGHSERDVGEQVPQWKPVSQRM